MFDMFKEAQAKKKELRAHQRRAIEMIRNSLAQKNQSVVCQMPTGAGKTVTAAAIIEMAQAKGNSVIFTAPAVSLIDQTVEAFEDQGISDIGVMQANHPRTNPLAQVQVASVQTLARREIPSASLVIVDECHVRADVIDQLMAERKDVRFIGLSATPWRKGMGRQWDDLVIPVTIKELIDAGLLSQFAAYAPSVPNLSGVQVRGGEYVEKQLQDIMGEAKVLGHVVQNWLEKGSNRPTLCFGINRAHAQELAAEFARLGIATAYVDAFTDTVERTRINREFRAGEIKVICSVRTMTTGVDLPVSCIIDAAPTLSEMLHIQKIGRGLRVNPGTEDLVIFDHAGNLLRLGMPDEIEYDELDKTEPGGKQVKAAAEKLPKECANCAALHTGTTCPFCGHEKVIWSGVEIAAGDLVQISGKVVRATKEDKQRWYSAFLWISEQRQYNKGWAYHKYKARFGMAPHHSLQKIACVPDQEIENWVKSQQDAWKRQQKKAEGQA
ncbi:DEAD/DEAH box helicase [uncultured Sphingomonas sp.]|uniref:DEAD/DEAH box helicase n=1 Tax=uncultured Sphingomonas sp. TaxID=158754 RepID=UPI0025CE2E6A|nr:DEAD/DEAH box helicase [uncultured Sphingomonas sp.]